MCTLIVGKFCLCDANTKFLFSGFQLFQVIVIPYHKFEGTFSYCNALLSVSSCLV
jgi:hypothetical protein